MVGFVCMLRYVSDSRPTHARLTPDPRPTRPSPHPQSLTPNPSYKILHTHTPSNTMHNTDNASHTIPHTHPHTQSITQTIRTQTLPHIQPLTHAIPSTRTIPTPDSDCKIGIPIGYLEIPNAEHAAEPGVQIACSECGIQIATLEIPNPNMSRDHCGCACVLLATMYTRAPAVAIQATPLNRKSWGVPPTQDPPADWFCLFCHGEARTQAT